MKSTIIGGALATALLFLNAGSALADDNTSTASTTMPAYCPTQASTTMGYFVGTDMPSYAQGGMVNFCLIDNTRNPLFFSGLHPWEVRDASGTPVFTPAAGTLANASGTNFFTDSWSGMGMGSSTPAAGMYSIVFPGLPGTVSTNFTITGPMSTTTWSGATIGLSDLDNVIGELQDLAALFPQFAGAIQGAINQILGSGTTVTVGTSTPMGSPMIEQNGQTFSAGGSVDFSGRNFGHEEQVAVMLQGTRVAWAHADGGGNFSTGSFSLPTTPGTYTYTFIGQSSGMSTTATITLR